MTDQQTDRFITILDVAKARGVKADDDGFVTMADFNRVRLPFFGGCQRCEASLAAYNMYPSNTGYVQCRDCIGDDGFVTVADFDTWVADEQGEELEPTQSDHDGRLAKAKRYAHFIVRDLGQIKRMVNEGLITNFSSSFMHAKFTVDALGYVRVYWHDDRKKAATPVACPTETRGGDVEWDVGHENEIFDSTAPPDGEFETIFHTNYNYAGTYIALMFMREEIFRAFDAGMWDAPDPERD